MFIVNNTLHFLPLRRRKCKRSKRKATEVVRAAQSLRDPHIFLAEPSTCYRKQYTRFRYEKHSNLLHLSFNKK